MHLRRLIASVSLLSCIAALCVAACAGSPKSSDQKPKRTVLSTKYDDARVGAESAKAVAAQMGLLNDAALDAYVTRIGKKLLRGIPRRSFQYQFQVVDQLEPNAFALPGGYIFISRGLLALANNEDELACVIGHEITHAARRHSAAQQELARRGNPLAMPWNRAATQAAYGRDMEREADEGGQMLAAAAGYDPMGMSTFLQSMGQMERMLLGHTRVPTFFDTHPGSQERASVNAFRAREIRWKRDPSLGNTHANYLRTVDGLPLGQRPEAGIFEGDRFLHPDLDFQIHFPRGWRTSNSTQAVGASTPRGDAVIFVMADMPEGDPQQIAQAFAAKTEEEQGMKVKDSRAIKIGHLDAWRLRLEGGGGRGSVVAYVTLLPYRGLTWRITGVSAASAESKYRGRFFNTARSFRPLTEKERASIWSTRLRLETARPGESLEALSQRSHNAWNPSLTAVSNALFTSHHFDGGELVKIAHSEPYASKQP